MNIVPTFDTSDALPQLYIDAVNYVVNLFNTSFATDIEIDITFGFTPFQEHKGPARNNPTSSAFDYATVYVQFQNTSPDSNIAAGRLPPPPADPTNGGAFQLTTALQKAYGFTGFSGSDGRVELNSEASWSTDFTSPPGQGLYDTASAIAHEISEVMGRIGHCGISSNGLPPYAPMDLFRFTAPGVLNVSAGPANYSLDCNTLLLPFNDPSTQPTRDAADWDLNSGDCFGSFSQGMPNGFSTTDYTVLRGIGYTGVAAPAPIFAI